MIENISVYKDYGPDRTMKLIFYGDKSVGIGLYQGESMDYQEIHLTTDESLILLEELKGRLDYARPHPE